MKSRLLLCSLAGALALAGCLDRKTGGSDAAAGKGDTASAADAKTSPGADSGAGRDGVGSEPQRG